MNDTPPPIPDAGLPDAGEPIDRPAPIDDEDAPAFVPVRITAPVDWIIAAIAGIVFFALYWTTSALWAHPGPSARLTATIIGAVPAPVPAEQAVVWFYRHAASLVGQSSAASACAIVSIAIAALDVALAYLLSTGLFRLLTDVDLIRDTLHDGPRHAAFAPRFGGLVAMLALALSAPFWTASSRVNSQSFHLLFLMLAAYLLLRYLATDRLPPLMASAALYGALCTQSPAAIQFFPLIAAGVIVGSLRSERPWRATFWAPLGIAAAAFAAASVACILSFASGPSYELMGYVSRLYVVLNYAMPLFEGSIGSLTSAKWLILGGLIVLPFFAWIAIGRISLAASEKSRPLHYLNFAILLATLTVLLGSRYAPWSMFGFQPEQVTLYTMAAMSLGYCALAFHVQLLLFFERAAAGLSGIARGCGAALRFLVLAVMVVVLFFEARSARREADAHATAYLRTYVDGVLDSLAGRDVLVTDELFADLFRVRAIERGSPVVTINLMESDGAPARRLLRRRFEDRPELRNAMSLGILSFLQEYIDHEEGVDRRLALTYLPDLWNLGPYRAKTLGLVFVGIREDRRTVRSPSEAARDRADFLRFLARIAGDLGEVPEDANAYALALADSVRHRVSFVGNDLGYVLETEGHPGEALEVYRAVHRFDPANVSTMLNLFTALGRSAKAQQDPEALAAIDAERAAIRAELEAFRAELRKPLEIWELSRSQGYVYAPEAFAALGWSWAMTGQTPLALGTLGSALRDLGEGANRSPLLLAMAAVHVRQGDAARSEEFYQEALRERPDDVAALSGLAVARLAQGRTDGVAELLDRLAAAGAPVENFLQTRVQLLLAENRPDEARDIALAAVKETRGAPEAIFALFTADMAIYARATPADRPFYRTRLEESIERLRENPETINYQGAIASGALHYLDQNWGAARDDFLRALLSSPGDIRLLEQVLRLDYALRDPAAARRRASALLRMNPNHGFANYVMGSLALRTSDVPSAIAYLQRAVDAWHHPVPIGDLAYAWQRAGYPERAEAFARESLAGNPDLFNVHDTLGLALLDQGRTQEAADCFLEAIRLHAEDPAFHVHLARAHLTLGQADAAVETLQAVRGLETELAGEEKEFYSALRADLAALNR